MNGYQVQHMNQVSKQGKQLNKGVSNVEGKSSMKSKGVNKVNRCKHGGKGHQYGK